ncbi:DUF2786 domain-containing protein [Enterococcus gilvus]|uniref:DUF2786 domain-containing protein n=1 Tax=Enterococcus gilvus TaxID=160453 RepID=UPI0005D2C6FF|nr:DUF2786 domain-containing protein [Enterococcus gilvus]
MENKRQQKIQKLLALANDANDEESMTALAKAQELMLEHKITEDDLFYYKQQQTKREVVDKVIYQGRPEVKRKWKRKCQLKQDYIEGYLRGLSSALNEQVTTKGYELALQLPEAVIQAIEKKKFVEGKDVSHKVQDNEALVAGFKDGLKYKQREMIT